MSMPDHLRAANDEIATIVLVENPDAIERIEEIVAVDGVDAAVIGTHDLAVSMGYPGRLARRQRLHRGAVARMVERGYQLLALGFDWSLLQRGVDQVLPGIRTA